MPVHTQINSHPLRPVTLLAALLATMLAGCFDYVEPEEKVTARIMPVARFEMASAASADDPAAASATAHKGGERVYAQVCKTCHDLGISGAPKMGDKAAWAPRIATGMEALYQASLLGKNVMPPKGGNSSLSDEDVKEAVDFIVAASQ